MIMRRVKSHTSASTPSVLRNKDGQWIILAGFAVSIALTALVVLLNLSFMAGLQSSQAEIDFPMYEIRELYDETSREMNTAAIRKNETDVIDDTMVNFGHLISQLYLYHGQQVSVSVNTTTNYSETAYLNTTTVTVALAFDDGVTEYTEHLASTST